MSANSPAKTISLWLQTATAALSQKGIPSARLDAELLVVDITGHNRAWVLAHPEYTFTAPQLEGLSAALAQRLKRIPLAYIRGKQEFYGRTFTIDKRVMVPRPESEVMITLLKNLPLAEDNSIVDVGTGSGCLGITAALELPHIFVTLSDNSPEALSAARQNAMAMGATIRARDSDLLRNFPNEQFAVIMANLPYVDTTWECSPETTYEPARALFAKDGGLAVIKELITQSQEAVVDGGYLLLEADLRQHKTLKDFAKQRGFRIAANEGLIIVLQRAS